MEHIDRSIKIVDDYFKAISTVTNNLLINNINFKTGYYAKNCPSSDRFCREVMPSYQSAILNHIDDTQKLLSMEWTVDSLAPKNIINSFHETKAIVVNGFYRAGAVCEEGYEQYLTPENRKHPRSLEFVNTVTHTRDFITHVLAPLANAITKQVEEMQKVSIHELTQLSVGLKSQDLVNSVQQSRPTYVEPVRAAVVIIDGVRKIDIDAAFDVNNLYMFDSEACIIEWKMKNKLAFDHSATTKKLNSLSIEEASYLTACACIHLNKADFDALAYQGATVNRLAISRNDLSDETGSISLSDLRDYFNPCECTSKSRPRQFKSF